MRKPKFATGSGPPPIYLSAIDRETGGKSTLVFSNIAGSLQTVLLSSEEALVTALQEVIEQNVPL